MDSFGDVMKSVQNLKRDPNFQLFHAYLEEMFVAAQSELMQADNNFRQVQGKALCLQEILGVIANSEQLAKLTGQSSE